MPSVYPIPPLTLVPTLSPMASVLVQTPPKMVVSEDGVTKTAALSLRLTTEPLSSVSVSLTSRLGGVSFLPTVVTFDYTNFADFVNISVFGVDDDGLFLPPTHPPFILAACPL